MSNVDEGFAESWWFRQTLKFLEDDVECLSADQLARVMAEEFGTSTWDAPRLGWVEAGRKWAMIADGCVAGTFVFPWVTAIRTGLYPETRYKATFLDERGDSSGRSLSELQSLTYEAAARESLEMLTEREAEVIRGRMGLGGSEQMTLQELGDRVGVTRERIRQIETKAIRKLRHPNRSSVLWRALAADFVQSQGALLLDLPALGLEQSFVNKVFAKTPWQSNIPGVNLFMRDVVSEVVAVIETLADGSDEHRHPAFMTRADCERLERLKHHMEEDRRSRWNQPQMLRQALLSLGGAAHYTTIAEECNRLFPAKQTSTRSWHAALLRPECENYGIVWIGRKGMYGLKEHGYSRPDTSIFDTAARIVIDIHARMGQPVAEFVVIQEMETIRGEVSVTSVKMALSLNDRLTSLGNGMYVPRIREDGPLGPVHDIDAAYKAFVEDTD